MENQLNRATPSRPERDTGSSSADTPPPIPDGGLAASMPEWLQRPPAWRGMTVREPERRDLPPPDTSVIDPRTMLQIDDLPEWLQRIAARATGGEPEETAETDTAVTVPSEGQSRAAPVKEPVKPSASDRLTGVPVSPSIPSQAQPRPIVLLPAPASRPAAWWRSSLAVACLALVILLIVIWLILVSM